MLKEMAAYTFAVVCKFANRLLNVKSLKFQNSGNRARAKNSRLAKRFIKSKTGMDSLSSSISRRNISLATKKIEKTDKSRVL